MLVRRPSRWVGIDGSTFTFPLGNLTWVPTQALTTAFAQVAGADYPVDYQGGNIAPKAAGDERISFWIIASNSPQTGLNVDAQMDAMFSSLINGAMGKLYTIDDNAVERWAYARINGRPTYSVDPEQRYVMRAITVAFTRLSDWRDVTATTGTVAVSATPANFNITNPGNAVVRDAVFVFAPTGGSPLCTNPVLLNLTTGYSQQVQYLTAALPLNATTMRLKIDSGFAAVLRSTDSGASYPVSDYTNLVVPATQVAFMELAPGVNSMQLTDAGTPAYSMSYSFLGAYH